MDFVILKVNGQDVSRASHEDAVRAFQAAREPIVVEVRRRSPAAIHSDPNTNSRDAEPPEKVESVTAATQTESPALLAYPEFPPPPPIEDDDDSSDSDAGDQHFYFEEVTLARSVTSERLGLTLYYPDGDGDERTDVLVQNVEPGGVAARDGRVQPGDQIVQVNGEDVCSKDQAERLLSAQTDVTLLVCRPSEQVGDEYDIEQALTEALNISSQTGFIQPPLDNRVVENIMTEVGDDHGTEEKRDTMKSGSSTNSSGSTASTSSQGDRQGGGTIDSEMRLVHRQMASIQRQCASLARRRRPVEDHVYETIAECSEPEEPLYCQPYEPGQLAGWLTAQPEPWRAVDSTGGSGSSGDSRTAGEALQLSSEARRESAAPPREASSRLDSNAYVGKHCRHCQKCMRISPGKSSQTKNKNVINSANTVEKNRNYITFLPPDTCYTNAAHLQETIQQQQQQLYQQLLRRSHSRVTPAGQSPPARRPPFTGSLQQYRYVSSPSGDPRNLSLPRPAERGQPEPEYQYRVKVRADGSRYIARRPPRRERLRERAARIAEERTGITTDDDAMSELKLGRYWSKEDRKKQLEHAKEKKLKLKERSKMTAVPEEITPDESSIRKRQTLHDRINNSTGRKPSTPSRRKPQSEEVAKHGKTPKNADIVLSVTTV